jgi:hypothetical protein
MYTYSYTHACSAGCGDGYQSMDHLLFLCPNLSAQRDVIKQQIGTWPVRKEDFASKDQKEFSAFVNAIDFYAIQQIGQQI